MKPTRLIAFVVLLAVVGAGAYFLGKRTDHSSASATTQTEKTLYTCGMHPQVIQDHPGNCPICGMKLTPVRKLQGSQAGGVSAPSGERKVKYYKSTMIPGEVRQTPGKDSMGMEMVPVYEVEAAMDATIRIDPVTIQNMGVRTAVLTNSPLRRVIRTVATIDYDETALADVTTKFKGWVEKLYVDAVGAQVHRGDPLFEVYSPELYSAQTEYLLALQATPDTSGDALRETARTKLKFYDISPEQIAELDRTAKPQKTLKLFAPIDGFVTEKMVVEGQMVDSGMKLYRLANLDIVWLQAQIYEQDLPFIKLGQEAAVSLSYLPGRKFRGRATYVYPTLDPKTRTAQVRMEFHNPGYFLKPGMFASAEIVFEISRSALLMPDMAILRSGAKNTVFVALEDGKFEPRTVTLGARGEEDMIQVLSGLAAGERVVTSGQFMLDSESQLREAIQKMLNPPAPGSQAEHAHAAPGTFTTALEATSVQPGKVSYFCPMPEHVAIRYEQPGKCPLCGMALVPVTADALAKMQPGGAVEYYTCPMSEHADVKLDKPGKCPRCRMTLIPVMPKPPEPEPAPAPSAALLPKLYTCPMAVCQTVTDQPGRCPECEMTLVPNELVKHAKQMEALWRQRNPAAN